MKPTHIAALLVLVVAVPATAGSLFSSTAKPCFIAGTSGYQISASADITVRIVSTSAKPSLRMQLVDDSFAADFVLVDDSDTVNACTDAAAVQSIRIDPNARNADLTVVLSRQPADYKIYVRSAIFSEQDAAALFAVMWKAAGMTGAGREYAARN